MRSSCIVLFMLVHRPSHLCIGREVGHPSVCLGGCWLVVRSPSPLSLLPDPFSLNCLSWACQRAPRSFPYSLSFLQQCFGSAAGQWFVVVSSVMSIRLSTLFPDLLNRDPASLYQRALSGLPETITQLKLQSSSFALTRLFRHWQLNTGCSFCHPSRYASYSSGHGLINYLVPGWLLQQQRLSNPGGLRCSSHLIPILHISH